MDKQRVQYEALTDVEWAISALEAQATRAVAKGDMATAEEIDRLIHEFKTSK